MEFRADHVGSLLRPPSLLEARRLREAGQVDDDALHLAEDAAIADAVRAQEDAGIDVVTDGEFRRGDFRTGFVDAVDGMTEQTWDMPWHTSEGAARLPSTTWVVTGRLRQRERLAGREAGYLLGLTGAPVKVTLIAPGFLAARFWSDGETDRFYSSPEELAADVAAITRAEVEALIADGVRYVQLDNPGYSAYLGARAAADPGSRADLERMLGTDAAAVEGIARPPGVTIGMHVCRGNRSSMWMGEGDYEPIAEQMFGTLPVDRFLLEYDDERAGGFEPLRFVPAGTGVVLGLVSSKAAALETADSLAWRIGEAAKFVSGDDLALSPQCGFASVAEGGNLMTADEQFAKLRLVADVARAVWGAS